MASFLEKLKRSMGIEEIPEEKKEIKPEEKVKKRVIKVKKTEPEEKIERKEAEIIPTLATTQEEVSSIPSTTGPEKEQWLESEGELAIDVYQTETQLVIQAAIAGVKSEDLDISLERDILTIKGNRQKPFEEKGDYFIQECYWGSFTRKLILPVDIDPDQTDAVLKDGILTIRITKLQKERRREIKVKT